MTNKAFFSMTAQQYELQRLSRKVESLESGAEIVKLKKEKAQQLNYCERVIKKLKKELELSHAETTKVRRIWFEVFENLEKENEKIVSQKDKEIEELKKKNIEMARQRDEALDKLRESKKSEYEAKTALQEAQDKIEALNIRINKDYTNSSKPSSQNPNHKKISNGRVKSRKKPGAQPKHEHYPRKKPEKITKTVEIPPTEEMLNNPDLRPTGKYIEKYLVSCMLIIETTKYRTQIFRNSKNGSRVHAAFPEGVKDEVNYDGTVKACAYLMKDKCNVSIGNVQEFLREISNGELNLSTGMISNLTKEFSAKTEKERDEIFLKLYSSPVMHADFTFGRVAGNTGTVLICADEDGTVLYQSKDKKGDEGVKESPLEYYKGTTVTDHEAALIKHGEKHQECLSHISRYLVGSIENEKNLTWNKLMKELISEALAYWNNIKAGTEQEDNKKDADFLKRYDEIVELAKKEYDYEPPNDYYREGYNLYKRMYEDKEDYVLFLKDKSVPPTNNIAERYARVYKRKNIQAMCFRSKSGVKYFCDGLSVIQTIKNRGENLFSAVTNRFNKKTGV